MQVNALAPFVVWGVINSACISVLCLINNAQWEWIIQHQAYLDQKKCKYHLQQITINLRIIGSC